MIVRNNNFRTGRAVTESGRALKASASNIGYFSFVGNHYESDVGAIATPIFQTFNYKRQDYHSNSWQPTVTWANSIPTTGTWMQGDSIYDANVAAAGVQGWVCTADGTFSSATDATGDPDGSTAVIPGMTDTSDFEVNDFVTVSAGFPAGDLRIIAKTATSVTLSVNSDSAETNVTVATVDPVFNAMAAIAA